jgi:hypothetical protein
MNRNSEFLIGAVVGPVFGFALIFVMFVACTPSADPEDIQAAEDGANEVLSSISVPPDGVEVLKIYFEDFDDGEFREWGERTCAISRRNVVVGSTRSIDDVVEAYATLFEEVGFERKGIQFAHSATLYSGERDSVHISVVGPWVSYIDPADQDRWRSRYPMIVGVRIQTVVPGRFQCELWSEDELSDPYAIPTVTPRSE